MEYLQMSVGKTEGSTRLTYTGIRRRLEQLKIETRLKHERFESVKGECVCDGSGTGCWIVQVELLKLQKNGQFPDDQVISVMTMTENCDIHSYNY
jgi:hypothetical protein